MKYYKNNDGEVYAYDETQTPIDGLTLMTKAQVEAHINPKPTAAQNKQSRIAQIEVELIALDKKSIRPMREGDTEYLVKIKAQVTALRNELRGLDV